ncbi:MAG: hypothetical protein ACI31R_03520 [Bacilli bacterium]
MREEKHKNTGLIVTIVILIVLLLGLGGYTAYDKLVIQKDNEEELTKVNDELKSAKEKVAELEKENNKYSSVEEKNYIVSNLNGENKEINVYGIGDYFLVYAYKNKMYVSSDNNNSYSEFTINSVLYSEDPTKSSDNYDVIKLEYDEKDVSKVLVTNDFSSSDARKYIYVILKDGTVKRHTTGGGIYDKKGKLVLKDYKVKDLRVSCGGGWENCRKLSYILTYKLTLQDGTTKTVEER